MTLFTSLTVFLMIAFVVVAVAASIVAVGVLTHFVVTNRRTRLARQESVRSYYGGFALSH